MCCSVLQCVAGGRRVLQSVAECCRVSQCVAVCCRVLQSVALRAFLESVARDRFSGTNEMLDVVVCI